jgi:hypothetical protein
MIRSVRDEGATAGVKHVACSLTCTIPVCLVSSFWYSCCSLLANLQESRTCSRTLAALMIAKCLVQNKRSHKSSC